MKNTNDSDKCYFISQASPTLSSAEGDKVVPSFRTRTFRARHEEVI